MYRHLLSVIAFLFLCGCEGPVGPIGPEGATGPQGQQGEPGSSDKQIRLALYSGGVGRFTWTSEGHLVREYLKFNIDYYPGVDSVIFVARIETTDSSNAAIAQLRDGTNDTELATLRSRELSGVVVESDNILSRFPSGEITLSVWIKREFTTDIHAGDATMLEAYLYLYRSS